MQTKPRIGQTVQVYGQTCIIIDIEDYGSFGNLIVETLDGSRCYRIGGQSWVKE